MRMHNGLYAINGARVDSREVGDGGYLYRRSRLRMTPRREGTGLAHAMVVAGDRDATHGVSRWRWPWPGPPIVSRSSSRSDPAGLIGSPRRSQLDHLPNRFRHKYHLQNVNCVFFSSQSL